MYEIKTEDVYKNSSNDKEMFDSNIKHTNFIKHTKFKIRKELKKR